MLTPPLDIVPGLPAVAVSVLNKQAVQLIKKIGDKTSEALEDVIKLPDTCKCNDPRIPPIKEKLAEIQELISKIQEIISVIQKIQKALNIAIQIANAAKAALLLVPVVGQGVLLSELMIMQNMTVANAMQAVKGLDLLPVLMSSGMDVINKQLSQITIGLSGVCPNDTFAVSDEVQQKINETDFGDTIPIDGLDGATGGGWRLVSGIGDCGRPLGVPPSPKSPYTDSCGGVWVWFGSGYYNPDGIGWGTQQSRLDDSTMGTEVYSDINVSDEDLNTYSKMIDNLVKNQQDLLTSLQEAPAQSYNGTEPPNSNLGKSGDYYIDTAAQKMYGPKTSEGWPPPVNY